MNITASGILSHSQPNSSRANLTFPTVTALTNGTLLATWRAGSTKDSADEVIEFARSTDNGNTWSEPWRPLKSPTLDGKGGTVKIGYLTELEPGHLLVASMWIDHTSYPGKPLFNEETEGCLPMSIILADSYDSGQSWSPWRVVPMPNEIGPASLTSPVLRLADGSMALCIENNKHYDDGTPWMQKAVFFHSTDQGQTWGEPTVAGEDPTGRIFNWDMRCGVAPDGTVATFAWTYDSQTAKYLNIHRRVSHDHGQSWSAPEDLGFADQAARPAILPDGRLVRSYVDRFQSHSIRTRLAPSIDAPFDPASEVIIYSHDDAAKEDENTGEFLAEMSLWSFGLPYAEVLHDEDRPDGDGPDGGGRYVDGTDGGRPDENGPDGDVMVVYYAGTAAKMDIHWARLRL